MPHTMKFELYQRTMLLIEGTQEPSSEHWDDYCTSIEQAVANHTVARLLVWTHGGAPNALQRKQVLTAWDGDNVPVAISSGSRLARIITTGISWFYKGEMRVFSADELEEAMIWLKIDSADREYLQKAIAAYDKDIMDHEARKTA